MVFFELSKNHSHMLAVLLRLHIVLRDEYIEGYEYVSVAVHFVVPQIKFARSKCPPEY